MKTSNIFTKDPQDNTQLKEEVVKEPHQSNPQIHQWIPPNNHLIQQ